VLICEQSALFSISGAVQISPLSRSISTLPDRKSINKVGGFQFEGSDFGSDIVQILAVQVKGERDTDCD
jgi:hypothetical protein